jgi:hypothetical protein
MDELLAAAAKATGMSETMVKRSAAARAKAQGTTVEVVLAEWAGVPVPAGGAPPAAVPEAPAEAVAPAPAEAVAAAPALEVEESGEETPAAAPAPAPAPVAMREVVPSGAIPRWLAGLFVAVPLFALLYLAFLPNGPSCGDAGLLAVDPVTGEMVNCDGTAISAKATSTTSPWARSCMRRMPASSATAPVAPARPTSRHSPGERCSPRSPRDRARPSRNGSAWGPRDGPIPPTEPTTNR